MRLRIAIVAALLFALPAHAETAPEKSAKSIEEITVLGAPEKVIRDFVRSYAAPVPSFIGQIARWKAAICPATVGLSPAYNKFLTARIREVAAQVGAPLAKQTPCRPNVQVVFTPHPQELMDAVRKGAPWLLGYHYIAQAKALSTVRLPVQAWYANAIEDTNGTLTPDDPSSCGKGSTLPPPFDQWCYFATKGSRISLGLSSEFSVVTIVVDMNKLGDEEIGPIADYITMLTLAQTKSLETCRALPTISNLMVAGCDAARKPKALSAFDIAYLRGLYQMNPEAIAGLQQSNLAHWMKVNLESGK